MRHVIVFGALERSGLFSCSFPCSFGRKAPWCLIKHWHAAVTFCLSFLQMTQS